MWSVTAPRENKLQVGRQTSHSQCSQRVSDVTYPAYNTYATIRPSMHHIPSQQAVQNGHQREDHVRTDWRSAGRLVTMFSMCERNVTAMSSDNGKRLDCSTACQPQTVTPYFYLGDVILILRLSVHRSAVGILSKWLKESCSFLA